MSVWPPPRSLAATYGIDVSFFSSGYLDVSVRRVPFHALFIGAWMTGVHPAGFPHSDTCGSLDICSSPQLFAAYRVFLRLLVPRHPPCALFCLTFSSPPYSVMAGSVFLPFILAFYFFLMSFILYSYNILSSMQFSRCSYGIYLAFCFYDAKWR